MQGYRTDHEDAASSERCEVADCRADASASGPGDYNRFKRWAKKGAWLRMLEALAELTAVAAADRQLHRARTSTPRAEKGSMT